MDVAMSGSMSFGPAHSTTPHLLVVAFHHEVCDAGLVDRVDFGEEDVDRMDHVEGLDAVKHCALEGHTQALVLHNERFAAYHRACEKSSCVLDVEKSTIEG